MNDAYTKALRRIMRDTSPAPATTLLREEIEYRIETISQRLKEPMNNVERLWLVEDRANLRKQLAVAVCVLSPQSGEPI